MAPARRNAEAQRFDLLVRSVTDYAIYFLDLEGHVTSWNAGAERIKGYSADEILGQHFSRFYTESDRATGLPVRALKTAIDNGRFEDEGWRVRKGGAQFWAMVVVDPVFDEQGKLIGFAKITRDMTERREAQLRFDEAREQLFQSQKMEALGQLTGGLAHDFNNLLTAISAGAELIGRNADDPVKVQRLAENVRAAAARGGALTKQLLAFARRQPLEPRQVDLQEQLPATAALLRHSLKPEIDLILEISDQVKPIRADAGQLELALLNLGFNARDAMPEGGELRIGARNVLLRGSPGGLEGEFVAISVADTGVGIAPENLERVLEPFFTTKGFGQGTGLGLSQAYGFAHQSGGSLVLESKLGTGVTVTFYLPVARQGAGADTPDRPGARAGRNSALILVVEDDPTIAMLAEELLDELGYRAVVVHNAQEALAALNATSEVGVLFSDVVMPGGMSGVELAKRVRLHRPELPVLLTTGYSEVASHSEEFPLLTKPYQLDDLAAALKALVPVR